MTIAEAVMAGQKLRQYIDESPTRIEENKLKAQLYKAQAERQQAEAGLITNKMQRLQQYQQSVPGLTGQVETPLPRSPLAQQFMGVGQIRPDEQGTAPQQSQTSAAQALAPQQPQEPAIPMDNYARIQELHSQRLLQLGLIDEYAKVQQGIVEYQKTKAAQRQEQLQNELGTLQKLRSVERDPDRLEMLRFKEAQLLGQLGKTNDMQAALERKLTVVPQGATVLESQQGQRAQEIYQNQGPEGLSRDQERLNVQLYGSRTPPPGFPQATQAAITYKAEQERLNAGLGKPQGTPAAPGAATQALPPTAAPRATKGAPKLNTPVNPAAVEQVQPGTMLFDGTIDGQTYTVEAPSQAEAEQQFRGSFPGRTFTVTPRQTPAAQAPVGPRAQLAGQAEAERLKQQGLVPGDPSRPVTGQRQQAEQNAQAGMQGATAEDVTRTRTAGENLDTTTQQKIVPLRHATRIIQSIKALPKEKQESYVGLLRKPAAELESFLADLNKASGGDKDLYRFLADVSDLRYTLTRPDVGASFTENENKLLGDVYPTARERTATAFFEKLDRLVPLLEQKMNDTIDLATTTRGQLRREQGQQSTPSKEAAPTPSAPTPSVEEKVRQMTPEQRLQRIRELEEKKQKAGR